MRKPRVAVPLEKRQDMEQRLAIGESLRSIAKTYGVTYPALQYHRKLWGYPALNGYAKKLGKDNPNWQGGESIDKWGYKRVYCPGRTNTNNYAYEHVLLIENQIGRRIKPGEHVHHWNEDKLDNRLENLYLCTASEHRTLHRKLEVLALDLVRSGKIVRRNNTYEWA